MPARALLIAVALLLACPPAAASEPSLEQARNGFLRAAEGDPKALAQAHTDFARLSARMPDNPLFNVYLGSVETLLGRAAWLPWTKVSHARRGLERIDAALAAVPTADSSVALEVRLVAARSFNALPDWFDRSGAAAALLREALTSPALASAPPQLRQLLEQARQSLPAGELSRIDLEPVPP